jgi:hypothetical protein
MRRLLKLLFLSLMCISFAGAQQFPMVPADMNVYLAGMQIIVASKIQSRSDWSYIMEAGVLTNQNYRERNLKYDTQGRIKEIEISDRNGYTQSIIVIRYDTRNLPSMETEFLPTGELVSKTKYTYDAGGNLRDITWLNNNEFIIKKNVYELDETMKIITEKQFISPDSAVRTTVFFYTDLHNGVLKEEWLYLGDKNLDSKIIFSRNSGNILENQEFRDTNGNLKYYLKYKYDPKGNLQDVTTLYPNGNSVKKFQYDYNASGLITGEVEYNTEGKMIHFRKYSYDQ